MVALSTFRDLPGDPIDGDTVFESLSINIFFLRFSLNDISSSVVGYWLVFTCHLPVIVNQPSKFLERRIIDIIKAALRKSQTYLPLTTSAYSDTKLLCSRVERHMDLYEAIKGRRSIRRFKPDPVPMEVLERIFEMAIWAPSGMNLQNWHFVVITGERKEALVGLASKGYDYIEPVLKEVFADKLPVVESTKKFFKRLGGAPVLALAYYEPTKERPETSIQSVAAAIQNLLLSAYSEGLGACWMTGPVHVADQINEFLSIRNKVLVAIIPIGYPDESPPFPKRKPNRVVYEGF